MSGPAVEGGEGAGPALDAAEEFLGRFVCFPSVHARVATVLWVAHTYRLEDFDSTPRLAFLSPEPGSGKTRALEVIGSLVRRPMHAVHCTPAALFRAVGEVENRPTILFDEVDTVFGPKAKDNEELRGFLNAGHRRSGVTYRCETVGATHRVVAFPSFAAVALAGLYDLPDTIASRSIVVRMRRRGPGERVEPYRLRIHESQGLATGERLARSMVTLDVPMDPPLPSGVTDRPADVWEPLLAVAIAVGGKWPGRAAQACSHFVLGADRAHEASVNIMLLADLRRVFDASPGAECLPTASILGQLHALEESPWKDLRGQPLDSARLARRLRHFEIGSVNFRHSGGVVKGYRRADLADVWARYLPLPTAHGASIPPPPLGAATAATAATTAPSGQDRGDFVLESVPVGDAGRSGANDL